MSKQRPETERVIADTALTEPAQTQAPATIAGAQVFRDTLYTSRTLIMPNGNTLPVIAGRVTAGSDEQYAFLKAHPDLQPSTE
nr:hypothetical protein [uncultured Pseudomonas sp.]